MKIPEFAELPDPYENNLPACRCYRAAGFRKKPGCEASWYHIGGEDWKCIEMELPKDRDSSGGHAGFPAWKKNSQPSPGAARTPRKASRPTGISPFGSIRSFWKAPQHGSMRNGACRRTLIMPAWRLTWRGKRNTAGTSVWPETVLSAGWASSGTTFTIGRISLRTSAPSIRRRTAGDAASPDTCLISSWRYAVKGNYAAVPGHRSYRLLRAIWLGVPVHGP